MALRNVELMELSADMARIQGLLLKRLDDTDSLFINGKEVGGATVTIKPVAPRIARQRTESDRIVSVFRILSVDSGRVGRGFRVRVRSIETGEDFSEQVSRASGKRTRRYTANWTGPLGSDSWTELI